jgi:hypothetical protein
VEKTAELSLFLCLVAGSDTKNGAKLITYSSSNSFLPQIFGIKQILAALCHANAPILSDFMDFGCAWQSVQSVVVFILANDE